jgi:SSS family transporter
MGFDSQLSPELILSIIAAYFLLLLGISYLTSRNADTQDFFIAGRKSPWILVAIGMIGTSLSGVTFISIPGKVGAEGLNMSFSYMQVVMGYLLGYLVIGTVLMPLYYRLNLTSIYGFLEKRFGFFSYKTGAAFFLLSRTVGAAFRLFLVAIILQKFVMDAYGIPFWLTVFCTIALIWVYTSRGGIKTIVWTDTLQTVFMLGAVVLTIISIGSSMEVSLGDMAAMVQKSEYSKVFFFENGWADPNNFFKQFFSGALIAIVMTGMDQDMMQKNLSCRNIREAQWNMATFSIILVFANLLFLMLGALLYIYGASIGLEAPAAGESDQLFPSIALQHLPAATGVLFILGLIAAAYSSADSALTSLTTSFCVDFLNFEKVERTEAQKKRIRLLVHVCFSLILLLTIVVVEWLGQDAVINQLFKAAGYTYGPILGLFTFGLLSRRPINDRLVILVCLAAPLISFVIDWYSQEWLREFNFGFLVLALNGILTFIGLLLISRPHAEGEEITRL